MINKELIKQYKNCEDTVIRYEKQLSELQEQFDVENSSIINQIKTHKEDMVDHKEQLKEQGLVEYKETGSKQLTGGLSIAVSKTYDYEDSEAIEWARKNMPVAILEKLNTKMFKAHIKDNKLDFVKYEEMIKAQFPKELKLDE